MADLTDAYAEVLPSLEVALEPEDVRGDLIIFAAGDTMPPDPHHLVQRDALARANLPLFVQYAPILARHVHGEASKPQPWRLHIGRSVCRIACLWRLCFQGRRDLRRYPLDASGNTPAGP